jgi:large subunit ribosomal protein L21
MLQLEAEEGSDGRISGKGILTLCRDLLKFIGFQTSNPISMYAVVSIPGRQVRIEPGQTLRVDFMAARKEGDKVVFDKVMLLSDGKKVQVGTPFLSATVHATVVAHERGDKVIVYKKKRRVDYHKKHGHRQRFTTVHIDSIEG